MTILLIFFRLRKCASWDDPTDRSSMSPIKSSTPYWFWVQSGDLESARISISLVESEQKIEFFRNSTKRSKTLSFCIVFLIVRVKISRLKSISEKDKSQHHWQSTILKKTTNKIRQWIEQLENCKATPIGKITQAIYHRYPHSIAKMLPHQRRNFKLWKLNFRLEDNGAVENEEAGEPKPKLQKVWYGKNNSF
ncbi:unnamed protein product [Caenorhabditis angaria]|uniref:Uncharacterized protein n=1 Tax=Caenorhabditis angaria TaxID=860376 RepID=A0A9P1IFC8_9PELO|nr:unnamed protein product [Caenorhabditis angaria]